MGSCCSAETDVYFFTLKRSEIRKNKSWMGQFRGKFRLLEKGEKILVILPILAISPEEKFETSKVFPGSEIRRGVYREKWCEPDILSPVEGILEFKYA